MGLGSGDYKREHVQSLASHRDAISCSTSASLLSCSWTVIASTCFQVCITHPAFRKMYLLANASILLQGGLDDAHQPGMIFPQAPRKNSLGLHRLVRVALLRSCGIAEIICHCANEIKKILKHHIHPTNLTKLLIARFAHRAWHNSAISAM